MWRDKHIGNHPIERRERIDTQNQSKIAQGEFQIGNDGTGRKAAK